MTFWNPGGQGRILIMRLGIRSVVIVVSIVLAAAIGSCSDPDKLSSNDAGGDTDSDTDSDTDTDSDSEPDSPEFACQCIESGNWYDATTNLCWQDPYSESTMYWYEATGTAHESYNPDGATNYCGDLTQGGFDDWRVPDIDELFSLVLGCVNGAATGDLSPSTCGVSDPECLEEDCDDGVDCNWCPEAEGPGSGGCYWHPDLESSCESAGHWSSSSYGDFVAWTVYFQYPDPIPIGGYSNFKHANGYARCVRSEL
jgi:hypothetical protein